MKKRIAVVTGASSGLGREYVRLFAAQSGLAEIWAIARGPERLARLKAEFGERVVTFSLDLSSTDEILRFARVLQARQPDIAYLVNSAGYAKLCSYRDLSIPDSANMVALNCSGVVGMGLACLPYMRSGAKLLNIASQAAFQPLPYQNLYSSTKAFVRNYSRALGVELRERGITVTAVCPGWMDTALYRRAKIGAEKATRRFPGMVAPGEVAAKSLLDANRGRDMSVYSLYVKLGHAAAKLLPQRAMMRLWLLQQGL